MNKNLQVAAFSKFITGKHGFFNGGKTEKISSNFWPDKLTNIGPESTKKMRNSNIWRVCFLRKVNFVNIFMR